jgi:membrane-associated phospholipid phosphatase
VLGINTNESYSFLNNSCPFFVRSGDIQFSFVFTYHPSTFPPKISTFTTTIKPPLLFMKNIFKKPGSLFLLLYILLFSVLFLLVLVYSREETHIMINSFHTPFLDILMKYWTSLGDGIVLVILLLGLMLVSLRHFFIGLAAYTFGGLGAQLFKQLFFNDFARPFKYFEINQISYDLYLVPGVDMNSWFSFPSGHTSTAFALFFALALMSKNKVTQIGLFILAAGVGYSRIYLSQHFLMDVVGGAFIGMIFGWLAWKWISRYSKPWLNLPLQRIILKKSN